MEYTVTLTSKNQFTVPVETVRRMDLQKGSKLIVTSQDDYFTVKPLRSVVSELSGSVKLPQKYKGKSIPEIVADSKKAHLSRYL